jgi:hypothetical protein
MCGLVALSAKLVLNDLIAPALQLSPRAPSPTATAHGVTDPAAAAGHLQAAVLTAAHPAASRQCAPSCLQRLVPDVAGAHWAA